VLGLAQAVAFGRTLRGRYLTPPRGETPLLAGRFNHAATHVRATDVDRTLSSASGIMIGLYGAADGGTVPVHTVEYSRDALLDGSSRAHCPAFAAAADRVYGTELVAGAIRRSTALLVALPKLTGTPPAAVAAMTTPQLVALLTGLRDLRVCQRAHNVSVPAGVAAWDNILEDVTARVTIAKWDVPGLGGLVGGRILRATARRMRVGVGVAAGAAWATARSGLGGECNALGRDADESGECPRRLTVYVGHDTTVFDVRAALGLPVDVEGGAPYMSHVILELRAAAANGTAAAAGGKNYKAKLAGDSDGDGDGHPSLQAYTVTVLTGSIDRPTVPEAGPFCAGASSCSVADFVAWIDGAVPSNVATACGLSEAAAAGEPGAASAAAADAGNGGGGGGHGADGSTEGAAALAAGAAAGSGAGRGWLAGLQAILLVGGGGAVGLAVGLWARARRTHQGYTVIED